MSDAVLCAPSRTEAAALRSSLDGAAPVLVTGTGPGRSRQAAAQRDDDAPVALAGIAGGLDPRLRPGDVVVADEVRPADGGPVLRCPSAPLLAARLRADGLRTWVGSLVSSERVVAGARRRALAGTGALAVDMESAWLLRHGDPAQVVVRVVADVAGTALLRPATVGRLRAALRTLPCLAPALLAWRAAVAPRTVLLAGPRSFCAGVERAIEIVERALDQRGAPVYVRRQIVHNSHVVADLTARGAVFVEELDELPPGATVVFSAHGVSPAVRAEADRRDLDVVDATCPLVTKVHAEVRRFDDRGDTVLLVGHAGHEEVVGTLGERPASTVLVEDADQAATVAVPDPERVSYLVQTTLSAHEADGVVRALRQRFPALKAPPSDDICYATTNRQDALRAVAAESDLVLVVGSGNSSNSLRLVEEARRLGTPAHLVDDVDDVRLEWLAGTRTVGLTAGASAPSALVDEVVDAIGGLGRVAVQERRVTTENVHFTLPKEVRRA